jgi:hypothetical protein
MGRWEEHKIAFLPPCDCSDGSELISRSLSNQTLLAMMTSRCRPAGRDRRSQSTENTGPSRNRAGSESEYNINQVSCQGMLIWLLCIIIIHFVIFLWHFLLYQTKLVSICGCRKYILEIWIASLLMGRRDGVMPEVQCFGFDICSPSVSLCIWSLHRWYQLGK